ncbi:MAG: LL-diaminopimelate aminotransferase [Pseudomonadota bacterium]
MSIPPLADRIRDLPPYLFAEIDRIKRELRQKGVDVIDLSIGDPDLPTPPIIIAKLAAAAASPEFHRYPAYNGSLRFRKAVALWYEDRFGVRLDPDTQVLALIGSKEGIAHIPLAFVNPGDTALVPDPGYPVYTTAVAFAGGTAVRMPLKAENGYLPVLRDIPQNVADKARLMFLNYPNNPTAAIANEDFFKEVVAFARKHEILVCHDAAYTEVILGGVESPSFLATPGALDVGIEFHSLSKTFNMTGWRVGFAVGNREAIAALGHVKTNIDSGVFGAIQEAAITALENWKTLRDHNSKIYEHRRDLVTETLRGLKIQFFVPHSTFYVWCTVSTKEKSADFCARILKETGVTLTPGSGFGSGGEGYFRISLTASEIRLQEALTRVEHYLQKTR